MINEKGLTLIEVIAYIAIASIILILSFSIMSNSKAEHDEQYKNAQKLTQNSYVMKQITSDIRESINLNSSLNLVTMQKKNSIETTYSYDASTFTLYRNSQPIANNLKSFFINANSDSVNIQLTNLRNEQLNTTIYLRRD
jgi:type II secretory pathway component PulJ